MSTATGGGLRVGIEALNVYCGVCSIPVRTMFEARRLDMTRMANLMMEKRAIALPFEDPITNAVNAAKPIIDQLDAEQKRSIEVLITASESGVDFSKSIASYVHEHLGLSRNCRILEVKQACYASTAAVQMATGYVASGVSPGGKVLVIGTDVSLVNARAEYMEPTVGTGGAAILVSDNPKVMTFDLGAFGNYSFETMDSARPTVDYELADVDGSLFTYLDCLTQSFADYSRKVDGADFVKTFSYLAMHTPFAGLVKAAHRKMMREHGQTQPAQIAQDFAERVEPSLAYPRLVGNLCSASVYLALSSLVERTQVQGPRRVGLFSYGSGCSSEFFSGLIDQESVSTLATMQIGAHLEKRHELSFDEYELLLEENLRCLRPVESRRIDIGRYEPIFSRVPGRRKMLALKELKDYHRKYEWI